MRSPSSGAPGAFQADPNGSASGSSYVVFGAASGLGSALDLSALDGSNGFNMVGEFADDRDRLLALLAPVQRAAQRSPLVAELVRSKAVFQAQTWDPDQAWRFLQDVPLLEESGQSVSSTRTETFAAPAPGGQGMTPCCPGISASTRPASPRKGRSSGAAKPKPATAMPWVSGQSARRLSCSARWAERPSGVR